MFPLIPLFALGAAAVYAVKKYKASASSAKKPAALTAGSQVSAISALGLFVRNQQTPPPIIIERAIAEAQMLGRADLVAQIVRRYVLPIVQAQRARAAERARDDDGGDADAELDPEAEPALEAEPETGAGDGEPGATATAPADAELDIDALVNASEPYVPEAKEPAREIVPASDVEVMPAASGETVTVSGKSSPIAGVDNGEWKNFVGRLSREDPTFSSARHVGRFRHRRDRLAELGIQRVDTPEAQEAALAADMRDAYRHARASGLTDHLSAKVAIDGLQHGITLSGLLGVIQAAGLEGATDWLDKPADRTRYPHTTAIFLKTNGVF